jgi:tetratricopeptide (TPR) repeat protein
MEIASADLAPIRELYGKSLYLQALRQAEHFGPFTQWSNAAARLLGGRLAIQLGAPRLGRWLHLRAYRDTPTHLEAIYYHARYRLEKFGPLHTWYFLREHSDWTDAAPELRADWCGLHGFVAARLRDFDRAERWLNKAESITPERPWLCIERAAAYEFAERLDDALAAARRSLQLQPFFRPGVQAEAHILQLLGREREALERLEEATHHIESGIIAAHLAGLQMDLGHYADARKTYELYAQLSPLMEEEIANWLAARRADTAYFCGDLAEARAQAARSDEDFYKDFAARLSEMTQAETAQESGHRLDLNTDAFHHVAGGSSILDAVCGYWGLSPRQPPPAEGSTFDGLPDVRERLWAEANGFAAAEFTVEPEAAFTLIERGVPFLLTMVESGYIHSQLVVGADRARHSLWVRDPADPRTNEAPLKALLERYAAAGPRGLALVPADRSSLLAADLPDRERYDRLHRLQVALLRHDRTGAETIYSGLLHSDPGHRITRQGGLALARYESNPSGVLAAINDMLALFPNDATLLLSKIGALRDLGRKDERFELAERQVARGSEADPLFAQHYAQMLMPDPPKHSTGIRILRRAVRRRPYSASGYYVLAGLVWEQRRFPEAADLYRFAAALDDRDEQFAEGYFRAARSIDQTPEAMRFLQTRFQRTKGKAAAPARALFYALSEQEEMSSAFAVLEQAYKGVGVEAPAEGEQKETSAPHASRSTTAEAGDVMLFAAEMRAHYNEPEAGKKLLEAAKPIASNSSWLRSAARIATLYAELTEARRYWEAALVEEPLASDIHRHLARTIADLEGRDAAIAWLRSHADSHPHFHPLQQLLIDWLRADPNAPPPPGEERPPAEPVIRRLIEQCPQDAWAWRELALHLANYRHTTEALAALEKARELEPDSPSYLYTLGHLCQKADRIADAREAYREAIERSVDNEVAIGELVSLARGDEDKEEALHFIADELQRQPVISDGLLAFRDQAMQGLDPEELLKLFQQLLDDHPDVWQPWSVTIQQLCMLGRLEEAHELAQEATSYFPLLSRLWVDLADVCHAQHEAEGQIAALRTAVEVAPGWGFAARELAEALEANHQSEDARVVLEQAVARAPLDPVNHGYLADNLWNSGESAEALARLRQALKLDPGYEWAWRTLGDWAERMECPQKAIETARDVARLRPGDPRAWLALVRMLHRPEHHEEALQALDHASRLQPRSIEAYDLKAERLAEMGRYDEARKAALPPIYEADPPTVLEGRAAWVEAKAGDYKKAIKAMEALVKLEPNYYWGWQQLAEWYNETGDSAQYLDAATHLAELRQDSPVALAMRGEAKLQTGDREGGKKDLREAQKVAPGYSFAGMLLFDAYLGDNEHQNARATLAMLQEHIGGSGQPFVAARYAQLAARMKDEEAAVSALREVCALQCDSSWPINTAVSELRAAGWAEQADRVLRESWENEEGFHPWTLLAWLDGPEAQQADVDEKLKAVDKVLTAHPRFVQGHDMKAELLGRANRFAEAEAACRPTAWGDAPPLVLRGREAWLKAIRGDRAAAIAQMRDILIADPDYYWGWQQLANWYDSAESHADYLDAAEHLVRLAPNDPSAYGYRGEARLFAGDRRGAKADFQKAFELDPNYAFAGLHLIDEQLAEEDFDGATRTLARLQEHINGPYVQLRAVRLAARQKDPESARKHFRDMTAETETPYLLLHKSAEVMTEAGWGPAVDEILDEAVEEEEQPTPFIGRLWVERRAARADWGFERELPALLDRGELGEEALFAAVDALGVPARSSRFYELMQRYDAVLRGNDRGWAKTGAGLVNLRDYKMAVTWMSDWRTRSPSEPWMFHPAALAYRMLGRYSDAEEISRAALKLSNRDAATQDFLIWAAFEDALAGRTARAADLLDRVDAEDLDDPPRLILALAEGLVRVQKAPAAKKAEEFAEARRQAAKAVESLAPKIPNPDLGQSYQRWAARLARDAGGLAAWVWAIWQKLRRPL